MWSYSRCLIFSLAALMLTGQTGCGFKPLYGQKQDVDAVAHMAYVRFALPEDRLGQQLRNNLIDLVAPRGQQGKPLYLLEIKATEGRGSVLVTRQESVSRFNITQTGLITLRREDSAAIVFTASRTVIASYNAVLADFADISAEREASQRASRELAEQLRLALAVFFQRYGNTTPPPPQPLPQLD